MLNYSVYDPEQKKYIQIESPEEFSPVIKQAESDYVNSRSFIERTFYYPITHARRLYHLDSSWRMNAIRQWDQQMNMPVNPHRSHIPIGIIRSHVDVQKSVMLEKPLRFIVTPLQPFINPVTQEDDTQKNAEAVRNSLYFVSDVQKFHQNTRQLICNALTDGTFVLSIGYQ